MRIVEHVALAPFTTLRIGGAARYFCTVASEAELLQAVGFARERNLPLFVLGGGSNLLVSDAGFDGLVLHIALAGEIALRKSEGHVLYEVPAGVDWDALVRLICEAGLYGVECLAGIPGLVGGSPIQNIGAYGQEVAQTIESVRALDLDTLQFRRLPASECGFAYRHSIFNSSHRDRFIVTQVTFRFNPAAHPSISYADLRHHFQGYPNPSALEIYEAVRFIRDRKGMLIVPGRPNSDSRSAGSFFKNPVVSTETLAHVAKELRLELSQVPHWPMQSGEVKLAAAWLIEHAGFTRGFDLGAVGISSRHTLALINLTGDATCAELLHLRDTIAGEVARRFHVDLQQEPVFLDAPSKTS